MAAGQKVKVVSAVMNILDISVKNTNDEDEEVIKAVVLLCKELNAENPGVRILNYFETVIPRYPDKIFKSHFRLRKASVKKLCESISGAEALKKKQTGGRPGVDLEKQVCIYL